MKVNINVSVKVTLTMAGAAIYNESMGEFPRQVRVRAEPGEPMRMPMWELMSVFGPSLYMGAPHMPFERNDVEILPDSLERSLGDLEYASWNCAGG